MTRRWKRKRKRLRGKRGRHGAFVGDILGATSVVRSEAQRALDALAGLPPTARSEDAQVCLYCGVLGFQFYNHGPRGCVLGSNEDNIGTVLAFALQENTMLNDNDSLVTEIRATDKDGNHLGFRAGYPADEATARGRSDAVTPMRCTILLNGNEITLDVRVFVGWARNALNAIDTDY